MGGGVEGVDAVGAEGADEEVALLEVGAKGAVAEGGVEVVNGGFDTLIEFLFAEAGEEDEVAPLPAVALPQVDLGALRAAVVWASWVSTPSFSCQTNHSFCHSISTSSRTSWTRC